MARTSCKRRQNRADICSRSGASGQSTEHLVSPRLARLLGTSIASKLSIHPKVATKANDSIILCGKEGVACNNNKRHVERRRP